MSEAEELRMLRERLGPRGLQVVMIKGSGHYVNEAVKDEIERLRAQVKIARNQRNEYQKRAQRARQHLVIFAEESNWCHGRRFDPTSAMFDGITFANKGLNDYDPAAQPFDEPLRHVDPCVLVPLEPTPVMTEAAHKASLGADEPMSPDFPDLNSKIWRAMIMAGVAEQPGAGAPETSVRCGAPAATLCEDCPPSGYPTEETRCVPCPRRASV